MGRGGNKKEERRGGEGEGEREREERVDEEDDFNDDDDDVDSTGLRPILDLNSSSCNSD